MVYITEDVMDYTGFTSRNILYAQTVIHLSVQGNITTILNIYNVSHTQYGRMSRDLNITLIKDGSHQLSGKHLSLITHLTLCI